LSSGGAKKPFGNDSRESVDDWNTQATRWDFKIRFFVKKIRFATINFTQNKLSQFLSTDFGANQSNRYSSYFESGIYYQM